MLTYYKNFFTPFRKAFSFSDAMLLPRYPKRLLCLPSYFLNPEKQASSAQNAVIPRLPALNEMRQRTQSLPIYDREAVYIVGVQHFLPTTATLFKTLIDWGIQPNNMLFADKLYSTVPEATKMIQRLGIGVQQDDMLYPISEYDEYTTAKIRSLWNKVLSDLEARPKIKTLILLDEGARLTEHFPPEILSKYHVIGIEQTRGGLYNGKIQFAPFPIIEVASSAVKKRFESPLIAASLIRCLRKHFSEKLLEKSQFGIIGYGAIGKAIAHFLSKKNRYVFVYDKGIDLTRLRCPDGNPLPEYVIPFSSERMLANNSDCILGCTGQDVTEALDIFDLSRDKIFASCSSEDKEFKSFIRCLASKQQALFIPPLNDLIALTHNRSKVVIMSGGFPINFDRTPDSDPHNMVLTRLLLLGSFIQALSVLATQTKPDFKHKNLMLDPQLQRYAYQLWRDSGSVTEQEQALIEDSDFLNWITTHSGGDYCSNALIEQLHLGHVDCFDYTLPTPTPS